MPPEVIDLTQSGDEEGDSSHDEADDGEDHDDSGSGSDNEVGGPGHEEELELPMDNLARAQLQNAIATVPASRLRDVVARLVLLVPAVEAAVAQELLGVAPGTVNVIPRYALCVHCGEEFDARLVRVRGECRFHPGMSPSFKFVGRHRTKS